jgi:prepilin-type N-terminal cleavage/methylation domain-containing protein
MLESTTGKNNEGFSLLELMIVLAIMMITSAIAVPRLINSVNDISLRYTASGYSGLLQSARIQAVKKNTFYSVKSGVLPSGQTGYYLDLTNVGAYVNGDPFIPINPNITIHAGTGSGAPNEAALIAGLAFAINPAADAPTFNARGLPCIVAGTTCPQAAGLGFAVFLSKPVITGNVPWTAIIITPSGHMQIWSCDNVGTWVQRD